MKALQLFIAGTLGVAAVAIIFVKAGQNQIGQSGGQQTAQIISASASGYSQILTALEGG